MRSCAVCGKAFYAPPSRIRKGNGKFCSRACYYQSGQKQHRGDPKIRFWSKVRTGPGCWEWTGARNRYGYGQFSLLGNYIAAHRYAYIIQNGSLDPTLRVLHHCDNPACVRGDHLYAGTDKDNGRDRAARKRVGGNPKLTPDLVRQIREEAISGSTKQALAASYGVSVAAIRDILLGTRWHDAGGPIQSALDKTYARGEQHPRVLVSAEDVVHIRERAASGETQQSLAGEYGVSAATISAIVRRVNWKWL